MGTQVFRDLSELEEHPEHKGYYRSLKSSYYWLDINNTDQVLFDRGDGTSWFKKITRSTNKGGKRKVYARVTIDLGNEGRFFSTAHTEFAETFLVKPEYRELERPTVNHLNGDKWDPRPCNLEWTTQSDNIKHAFITGLRDDRIEGFVINLRKQLKYRFTSLGNLGEFLNCETELIRAYIANKPDFPLLYDWALVIDGEEFPEVKLGQTDTSVGRKVLIELSTGEKTFIGSIKEAARIIGCSKQSLHSNTIKPHYYQFRGYLVRPLESYDEYLEWVKAGKKSIKFNKEFKVKNLLTGEIEDHRTASDLAKKIGVSVSTLLNYFKEKGKYRHYEPVKNVNSK